MQALARMRARPVYKGAQRVSAHLLLCTVAGNGAVHYAGGHHFSFGTISAFGTQILMKAGL